MNAVDSIMLFVSCIVVYGPFVFLVFVLLFLEYDEIKEASNKYKEYMKDKTEEDNYLSKEEYCTYLEVRAQQEEELGRVLDRLCGGR